MAILSGSKTRASDVLNINTSKKLWTVPALSASINVTNGVPAVISSAPSSVYRAGEAYRIKFHGLVTGTATGSITFQITDTNISGTTRMNTANFDVTNTAAGRIVEWEHYLVNATASDITRVLALSIAPTSSGVNTMKINAGATQPWFWSCCDVGINIDFPEAVAL